MQIGICQNNLFTCTLNAKVNVSLYDTIDSVPESDWLRFIPDGNPLLQPQYLKLLEDTQKGEMEFIYSLLHRDDRLIGVCYFQVVRFRGTNLLPYFPADTPPLQRGLGICNRPDSVFMRAETTIFGATIFSLIHMKNSYFSLLADFSPFF